MTVMVVTGGSQGIGAAVCRLAARRGWTVCFSYSEDSVVADRVAAEIAASGGRAVSQRADAANEAAVVALFAAAAALGPITALVNNAGITGPVAKLDDLPSSALERVMAVNVCGAFLALREATRRMATDLGGPGGGIVNVSSRASQLGGSGEWVHYAASKGAVDTLTLGAARELAPRGIRVNAVLPGLIDTAIHEKAGMPDRVDRMTPSVPMGRAGTAEEVAAVILWLLSEEAAYVTGALLPVSGGR